MNVRVVLAKIVSLHKAICEKFGMLYDFSTYVEQNVPSIYYNLRKSVYLLKMFNLRIFIRAKIAKFLDTVWLL